MTTAGAAAVVSPPPTPTPTPVFSAAGALEAGAAATTGNTNVQTYTGALKADAKARGWELTLRGSGIWAETNNVQSAGAWAASLRGDRKLFSIFGAYLKAGMDGDPFKGINNDKIAGAGITATWLARDPGAKFDHDAFRAEAGYQFVQQNTSGVSSPQNLQMGRLFAGYYHAVTKETTFSEELEVRYDFTTGGRYLTTSVTALAVKLRANLAFKASETIKGDTRPVLINPTTPALGTYKQDDTLTTGALILSF